MDEIQRCTRCVLPASLPSVELHEAVVCSHCRAYDLLELELERTRALRSEEFLQIISRARGAKRPYDCVVPLSGGKDSTYVLYLCSQVYDLRCICATLDNGYLTEEARSNIRHALEITGSDHITYRVNRETMLALYGASMRNCGMFCLPCNRGIEVTMRMAARAFEVPLIFTGHGKLPTYLSDGRMPEVFRGGDLGYFSTAMQIEHLPQMAAPFFSHGYEQPRLDRLANRVAGLLPQGLVRRAWWSMHSRGRRFLRQTGLEKPQEPRMIGLYDYVDATEAEITDTLASEMGWRSPGDKVEHLDCALDDVKTYVQMLKYPELTTSTIKNSGLVRAGLMSREEAMMVEERQLHAARRPAMLERFLADLNLSREEFESLARQQSTPSPGPRRGKKH